MQCPETLVTGTLAGELVAALRRHTHYGLTFPLEGYSGVVDTLLDAMRAWGGRVLLVLPPGLLQNHMWTVSWKVAAERRHAGFQMGVRASPTWDSDFYVRVVTQLPTDPSPYGLVVAFHRADTAALAAALAGRPFLWASPYPLLEPRSEAYRCTAGTRKWHVEEWDAVFEHERAVPATASERTLRRLQCSAALLPGCEALPCTKSAMLERVLEQLVRAPRRNVAFVASDDATVHYVTAVAVPHARPHGPVSLHPLVAKCLPEQQRAALLDLRGAGTCAVVVHHAAKNVELLVSLCDVVVLVDPYVADGLVALLRDCTAAISAMQLRVKFPVATPPGSTLFASAHTQAARSELWVELLPGGAAFSVTAGCLDRPRLSFGLLVNASRRHGLTLRVHHNGRADGPLVLLHAALLATLDSLVDAGVRARPPCLQPDDEALAWALCASAWAADPEAVSRVQTFWLCKALLDGAGVHVLFAVDGRMLFRGRGTTHVLGALACAPLSPPDVPLELACAVAC